MTTTPLEEQARLLLADEYEAGGHTDFYAVEDSYLANCAIRAITKALSSPMAVGDEVVERVARAINGPWYEPPETSKFTLEELRETRWRHLSTQERGVLRAEARAALSAIQPARTCEICDTPEICAAGRCPCTLAGEFIAPVPADVANKMLYQIAKLKQGDSNDNTTSV